MSSTSALSGNGSPNSPPTGEHNGPLRLYVRRTPRTVAIVRNEPFEPNALVLAIEQSTHNKTILNARLQPRSSLDPAFFEASFPPLALDGVLGVIALGGDVFVGVVESCEAIAIIDGLMVQQITAVNFVSLSSDAYDRVTARVPGSFDGDPNLPPGQSASGASTPPALQHPCTQLMRLLSSGTYYFAEGNLDLSRSTQYRYTHSKPEPDPQYLWNHHMRAALARVLASAQEVNDATTSFLVNVIQGYVGRVDHRNTSLLVISRVETRRAGTRYNTRGIDDAGAVANFVETEMIFTSPSTIMSFLQLRGSVPIFWDQPGIQVVGHKVQITRSREAAHPAFERHFNDLRDRYGKITAVNLVSQDGGGESTLGAEFGAHFAASGSKMEHRLVDYDFHAQCKGNNYDALQYLVAQLESDVLDMSCFLLDVTNGQAIMTQKGAFRINCVDCLDRTNVVQGILAEHALKLFVQEYPDPLHDGFKELWANNGDSLSRIYAGTGALKSGFTRSGKRTLAGFLDDSVKSVNRFVINNFQDKSRQETIDILLGKIRAREIEVRDPIMEAVARDMEARSAEFTSYHDLHVHVGTYNVNGKLPQEPVDTWLKNETGSPPDILVIGFQEIVELTPGQIVSADPMKRQQWQQELVKAIHRCYPYNYVLVCDGQLVGAATLVFAKSDLTPHIQSVEISITKTGLGGMTGNKGGISISFQAYDTTFCFVTAHFAAGQSNVDDRNRDFETISQGTLFKRGKTIADHDHIVWLGDFNYRVEFDNELARAMIAQGRTAELFRFDQLTNQRQQGRVFGAYSEGSITFAPTYKFNNGTNIYDTSEKNRVPSWIDRILYRSTNPRALTQLQYSRAELMVSDHKPVLAFFRAPITIIDHPRKQAMSEQLFRARTNRNPFRVLMAEQEMAAKGAAKSVPEADLLSLDSGTSAGSPGSPGKQQLPPPSTSEKQWWSFPPLPGQGVAPTAAVAPAPTTAATNSNPFFSMGVEENPFKDLMRPQAAISPASGRTSPSSANGPAPKPATPTPAGGWSLLD